MMGVRGGKLRFVGWFAWILFVYVSKSDDE